jgi:hypothetical protein
MALNGKDPNVALAVFAGGDATGSVRNSVCEA